MIWQASSYGPRWKERSWPASEAILPAEAVNAKNRRSDALPIGNGKTSPSGPVRTDQNKKQNTRSEQLNAIIHPKNKLNELTAAEWITRTVSVFVQKGLGSGSKEAKFEKLHPAPYSFTDVTRFIEFFTKTNGNVLDPFGGVASSAKAAALLGRRCTSVEISPYFFEVSKERIVAEVPEEQQELVTILNGDIRDKKNDIADGEYDLVLTSPPYWSILNKVDHKAKQERVDNGVLHNYGDNEGDLANIEDYDEFLEVLSGIFDDLSAKVRAGGHAVIIVGDFRHKSKYYMFHSDLARRMEEMGGWMLKGVSIMYQKHKRVFPYGYPYSYVPNLHHQYAMIFQKVVK